jgi:hypothetical protein
MDTCAATKAVASAVPLNLFIMFDDSGSMKSNNKWNNASAALLGFFKDASSADLRVALRFFPDNGCDNGSCDVNACSQPQIDIGALSKDPAPMDAQEGKLVAAVQAAGPNGAGGTPIFAALGGAEKWAVAYQKAHPAEKTAVILVTDGQPNGCDENITHIAKLAADAKAAASVFTYAVGLQGSAQSDMDTIAAAGGTTKGFFIGNGNAQQDLENALKAIQGNQLACEYQMPTGNNVDPTKVNVSYTPGGGGMVQDLGQVKSAADCTPQKGGWYYDDATNPTKITLCDATCTAVQTDAMGRIDILLGCDTKIQ